MTTFGIDKIGFYTPRYYLDLLTLAKARNVDPGKFCIGLGQQKMSLPSPDEDVVTMAASAAQKTELEEFKAGVVRSMKQYNAGFVKTFDNVDDFLADLHSSE